MLHRAITMDPSEGNARHMQQKSKCTYCLQRLQDVSLVCRDCSVVELCLKECDNRAERIIVSLPAGAVDQIERDLQMALIAIYNNRLVRRHMYHKVAHEHNLIAQIFRDITSNSANLTLSRRGSSTRTFALLRSKLNKRKRCSVRGGIRGHNLRRLNSSIPVSSKEKATTMATHHQLPHDSSINTGMLNLREPTCVSPLSNMSIENTTSSKDNVLTIKEECRNNESSLPMPKSTTALQHQTLCSFATEQPIDGPLFPRNRRRSVPSNDPDGIFTFSPTSFTHHANRSCHASATNSDSGIGSSESCAQSTSSSGSFFGDQLSWTSFFARPNVRITTTSRRRTRSNSDSTCGSLMRRKPSADLTIPKIVNDLIPSSTAPTENLEQGPCSDVISLNSSLQLTMLTTKIESLGNTTVPSKTKPMFKRTAKHKRTSSQICSGSLSWMKPFLRLLTKQEAQTLISNIQREEELRSELNQLIEHHDRGIRHMQDVHLISSNPTTIERPDLVTLKRTASTRLSNYSMRNTMTRLLPNRKKRNTLLPQSTNKRPVGRLYKANQQGSAKTQLIRRGPGRPPKNKLRISNQGTVGRKI